MLFINAVAVLAFQAAGASAAAISSTADLPSATGVAIPPESLFKETAIRLSDKSSFVPEGESIFDKFPATAASDNKGALVARTNRVYQCWSIDSLGDHRQDYLNNFVQLADAFYANNDQTVTLGPRKEWKFEHGYVQFVIRNQSTCQTYRMLSARLRGIMTNIWRACTNNAAGWTYYSISDVHADIPDLVIIVRPIREHIPGYTPQCN
ncbi:hypothetical protein N0V84_012380 [Fusarium piperis]|uniref:Uncharacterized protein n=1 Tax=Fusarium piperis TaxID=1435070 RepID=A0A9W8T8S6_9HYPO|nr:hypothetical protein N0V84_012380 [Fusarium piperis]